jgi:DNA-binding NarL/FixJ family response regulator
MTKKQPIEVVIVDDHPGVRAGIKNLLSPAKDIVVVGEGANGAEAIKLAREKNPDILLLDVELPILRGDEVVRRIRDEHLNVKVLAVSSYNDRMYIQGMMENGAIGYITKDEVPAMLVYAVRSIARENKTWISPRASTIGTPASPEEQTLTYSELEIINRLLLGKSEAEISQEMKISAKSLSHYLQLLMDKFGVDSTDALSIAARNSIRDQSAS